MVSQTHQRHDKDACQIKKRERIPSNSNYILTKINWMLVTKQISIPRKMKYVICLCDCECKWEKRKLSHQCQNSLIIMEHISSTILML